MNDFYNDNQNSNRNSYYPEKQYLTDEDVSFRYKTSEEEHTPNFTLGPDPTQMNHRKRKKSGIGKLFLKGACLVLCMCVVSVGSIAGYVAFTEGYLNGGDENLFKMEQQSSKKDSDVSQVAASGKILSTPQIVEKMLPSVVGITTAAYNGESGGSGIIMTEDGYIITNQHVIEGAQYITVTLSDGSEYPATVKGEDATTDLAVIKIDKSDLTPAHFGNSDELVQGETAIVVGNPLGLEFAGSATQGIISALGREVTIDGKTMTFIQTDASINPGNSGGPLVDSYGNVIGVTSAKISSTYTEGLGFAIPINDVVPVVEELINYGYVTGRPLIGISGENVTAQISAYYNLPQGFFVAYIDPESGAADSGILPGDIITAINGQTITNLTELNNYRDQYKAGDTVTLTVYRDGRSIDYKVVLGEANQ